MSSIKYFKDFEMTYYNWIISKSSARIYKRYQKTEAGLLSVMESNDSGSLSIDKE